MLRQFPILIVFALCGCAGVPLTGDETESAEADPPPTDPTAAFEKVGEPHRDDRGMTEDRDNLSRDIERLQNARRAYEAALDHRAAEVRRRQAECRASAEGREVPIEDGSENPATYCEEPAGGDSGKGASGKE